MPKTRVEKVNSGSGPVVEILDKPFGGMKANEKMLVATPKVVEENMFGLKKKQTRTVAELREALARKLNAHGTCPLAASMFLRIVSGVNLERMAKGDMASEIALVWRVVDEKALMAKKLSCGVDHNKKIRKDEGIGKNYQ